MSRKSYDQRIKERWLGKHKRKSTYQDILKSFPPMENVWGATAWILPFLLGKSRRSK